MNRKLKLVRNVAAVIVGNFVLAAGVSLFIAPSGLICGGATGIALLINRLFSVDIALASFILNAVMFILGFTVMGKTFALTTIVSTVLNPLALYIFELILNGRVITNDIFLCTLLGGCCVGVGIGLVIRVGASTGGMDIPPIIINKLTGLSISSLLWIFDVVILVSQIFFSHTDSVLYGLAMVIVYSVILDKVMVIGKKRMQLTIISDKTEQIRVSILSKIDRGLTMIHGKTGYLGKETEVILTVISSRELAKTEELIRQIDPEAFVVINSVSAVSGRGFSLAKTSLPL